MKKIILFAAAALTLAACDNNDDNQLTSTNVVQVSASIGQGTLSRAKDTSWSEGDKIGITVASGPAVGRFINLKYITDGSNGFTGDSIIYFYNPMTLTAYYPFKGDEGSAPGIITASTTAVDQAGDTQPFIDFLYAGETGIKVVDGKPVINFTFEHKMSKLTLKFESGNAGTDVSKITSYSIEGLLLDGTFDTTGGDCVANTDAGVKTLTISVSDVNAMPSLILFPQTVGRDVVKLTITDNENQTYACYLNFEGNKIEAGNNYNYTIKVSKAQMTVTSSITKWEDTELEGGASSTD